MTMPISHVTPAGGNVFADLEFSKEEAEALKICSSLMMTIQDVVDTRALSVAQAGEALWRHPGADPETPEW